MQLERAPPNPKPETFYPKPKPQNYPLRTSDNAAWSQSVLPEPLRPILLFGGQGNYIGWAVALPGHLRPCAALRRGGAVEGAGN